MQVQYSVLICLLVTAIEGRQRTPTVVLSVGAFNLDYLKYTPELRKCLDVTATAEYLMPVMPTKGRVNHMSIATGLFADGHGVIDDCEYDERKNECVYGKPDPKKTPIWIENQIHGGFSAVMDWPGAEYTSKELTYYENYKGVDYETPEKQIINRINKINSWLSGEQNKPAANLVMIHYDELDKAVHGNDLNKVKDETFFVQYFITELIKMLDMQFNANLIVLGSHGGITVNEKGGIDLNAILKDNHACHVVAMGANALVIPEDAGKLTEVHKILGAQAQTPDGNIKYIVYYQEDIPDIWHLKTMPLFQNKIFLVANIGYFFWNEHLTGIKNSQKPAEFKATVDGYWRYTGNKTIPFNHTFFMAIGSKFETRKQVPPFYTTDVHQLLRNLLELPKNENDQLSDAVKKLFTSRAISVTSPVVKDEEVGFGGKLKKGMRGVFNRKFNRHSDPDKISN